MPFKVYILSIIALSLFFPQEWDYSANIAEMKNKDGQKIKQFDGDVIINRDDLELKTDKAIQYVEDNEIHLYGNIQMNDKESNIKCQKLIYDIDNEYGLGYNNVKIEQKDRTIFCDTLYYWDKKDSLKALGNVKIVQSDQKRRLSAQEMNMYKTGKDMQILQLINSAQAFNISESKVSEESPMRLFEDEMRGNQMEAIIYKDTLRNLNIFGMAIANYNVIRDSLLVGKNNVSGDSIMLDFKNDQLSKMKILGGGLGEFLPEEGNSKVDSVVYYNAEYIEYMIDAEKSILKKDAKVDYGTTTIKSGNIVVDWITNMLDADKQDDIYPIISRADESPMTGESMRFDLINKKGAIRKGKTSFDNGFYHGKIIQREEPDIMHVFNSKYTSCELDHPHYYFGSNKMKMLQGDKIIARPLTLYIAELPVITLPFAIFPNKGGGRRTGWIMPSFGHRQDRGRFMQNLGYYWAPNDFLDLKFSLTLYDLTGFTFKTYFRYKERYKYNGNLRSTLTRDLVNTDDFGKIFTENSKQDWDLRWSHDQSFSPYEKLNIDLTYITSNNFYQSDNVGFDLDTRLKQKIESSVNYSKTWPEQKNSLTLYLSESYDLLKFDEPATENTIFYKTRTLPKINFRHSSTKLFGDGNNWYNNIFTSMSSIATGIEKVGFYTEDENWNSGEYFIDCNDDGSICEGDEEWEDTMGDGTISNDEFFINDKIKTLDYNSGVAHSFGISYSDKIFKWFSIKPTVSLKESWIFKYKEYDIEGDSFTSNYNYNKAFKRRLSGSLSMTTSTKLYGIIPFSIGKLNSFRHVVSPSVTFSYSPDLSDNSSLFQMSSSGEKRDYFAGSLVGSTPTSKLRKYSINIRNDFQAKLLSNTDNYEKINFLNWTLSTSYNPDIELGWADISSSIRAKLPKFSDINITMTHDLYKQEYNETSGRYENINKFESFPRLTYVSASTDINLSGNKFNYNREENNISFKDTMDFDEKINLSQSLDPYEPVIESGKVWDMGLRFQYSLRANNYQEQIEWDKTFWTNVNLNLNLSSSWRMAYSARFDLEENEIVNHSIYLFRPLHCWEFSFKWWPTGSRQGFLLNIYIKNPDLRDVKLKSTGGSFFGL